MSLPFLTSLKNGVRLMVQAVPRAKVTEVVDLSGDRCKIRVKAPPVEGEANKALVEFLARLFGLTKRQVALERGATGKLKTFVLAGISLEKAETTLVGAVELNASEKEKS